MPYYQCRLAGEDGRIDIRTALAPSAEECRKGFATEGFLVLSVRRDWTRLSGQALRFGRKVKDRDIRPSLLDQAECHSPIARFTDQGERWVFRH